jgi:thymidylate kinase
MVDNFFRGINFLKSVLITFSGIDGAGKSTQIQKLREYLTSQEIPFHQLAFWDDVAVFRDARSGFSRHVLQSDGRVGSPDRPAARRDKNLQNWPLFLGRAGLHLVDVIHLLLVVGRERRRNSVLIFDRYIYDQLAALPMDRGWARWFARLLLRVAPKPDISYLLDASPEVARERKPEYPLEFMRQYRSSYLELCAMAGLDLIPAAGPDDVHLAILQRLCRAIPAAAPARDIGSAVVA